MGNAICLNRSAFDDETVPGPPWPSHWTPAPWPGDWKQGPGSGRASSSHVWLERGASRASHSQETESPPNYSWMTHMRSTRLAARSIVFVAAGLLIVVAATVRVPADTPVESQSHLLNDIKYLASDELEGRGIGTKGLNKAADYIKEQFKEAGLDVTQVKGDAFQYFKMTTKAILGTPNTLKFVGPGGKTIELKRRRRLRPLLLRRRRQDQRRPRLRQLRPRRTRLPRLQGHRRQRQGRDRHATQPRPG